MQAQYLKDDVQEAQPLDSAAQKSVTDWLMHVISGKQQPTEEQLHAVTPAAPSMEPLINMTPPPAPKETNGAMPEAWNGAFTAEDLCGTPVIPLPPRVEEKVPAAEEITANDVCWVPEDRRLKPQPMVVAAPMHEPMAPVVDISRDIAREPAPHYVRETAAPAFVSQEKEITAADISRQWVIDEMEQSAAATVVPEPEPEQVPEQLYVPQLVSMPVREPVAEPEPVPEQVYVPQLVSVPVPESIAEPEPIAAVAAEPEVIPDPFLAHVEAHVEAPVEAPVENVLEPEPAPMVESAVAVIEPQVEPAEVEVAHAEPVAYMEPEITVGEAEAAVAQPAAAHDVAVQDTEAPEIAGASAIHADGGEKTGVEEQAEVAEPDMYAGVKVWAKGGYWDGAHPVVDGTEQPALEGKTGEEKTGEARITEGKIAEGKIEKGPSTAQQNATRGYFGSYLAPEEVEEIENAKPEGWSQSWRTLIRLGSALPWLSRALPALEAGMESHPGAGPGTPAGPTAAPSSEMQQDVAGMRLVQYEIRSTVQDHAAHLKRMEEQLVRVRESVESKSASRDLAENVQSAMKMLRIVGIGLGGLLVILIVLALVMVLKH